MDDLSHWMELDRAPGGIRPNEVVECKFVPIDDLCVVSSEWQDLLDDSVEPNACYAPAFANHFLADAEARRKAGAIVVYAGSGGAHGDLIGLWPMCIGAGVGMPLTRVMSALHSPFSGSTSPLVRRGFERQAIKGLFDCLATQGLASVLYLAEMRLDGPIWSHIQDLLGQRRQASVILESFQRPLLDTRSSPNPDAYLSRLKSKTRQTLSRKRRALERLGDVAFTAHSGSDLHRAMSEFLLLEQSGWKGAAGTAMAQSPGPRRLAEDVLVSPSFGMTRIEMLRLNGNAIASSLQIGKGDSALHFKPAYDEAMSSYSPGTLLHLNSVETIYRDRWAIALDSAVKPDDRLGSVWRDRRRVGSVLLAASPRTPKLSLDAIRHGVLTWKRARRFGASVLRAH